MTRLHDVYQLTITTLSPVHIGSGSRLLRDFDYVVQQGKTWVINETTLIEAAMGRQQDYNRLLAGSAASDLFKPGDFHPDSDLFRYVMPGTPTAQKRGSEIQAQIKNPWDQPYIPGSSLKGALRTALAFVGWNQRDKTFRWEHLNEKGGAKFVGLSMERQVLNAADVRSGREPNHDLLRALQVSDSAPDTQRRLRLYNIQVLTGNKPGSPISLEGIPKDVVFSASLTLDGFLRQPERAQELGWEKDQMTWIKNLPIAVNLFTESRLKAEYERWRTVEGPLRGFYKDLVGRLMALDQKTEFMLQLGWGGGWDSKTFGAVLTQDPVLFYRVVKRYEKQMDRQQSFKQGDRYPKSRRLVVNDQGVPARPLGWVHVRMEKG